MKKSLMGLGACCCVAALVCLGGCNKNADNGTCATECAEAKGCCAEGAKANKECCSEKAKAAECPASNTSN